MRRCHDGIRCHEEGVRPTVGIAVGTWHTAIGCRVAVVVPTGVYGPHSFLTQQQLAKLCFLSCRLPTATARLSTLCRRRLVLRSNRDLPNVWRTLVVSRIPSASNSLRRWRSVRPNMWASSINEASRVGGEGGAGVSALLRSQFRTQNSINSYYCKRSTASFSFLSIVFVTAVVEAIDSAAVHSATLKMTFLHDNTNNDDNLVSTSQSHLLLFV
jgi:hypothetical protein